MTESLQAGSLQAGTASPIIATRTRPARGLPPRARNLLLTTHIVVAVGLLGTDLVLLTLGVTALVSRDPELVRAGYLAMGLLADVVLLPLALAAPLTGILLGLGTPWGLVRHWWVLTKLVLTIAVATAAVFVLRPRSTGPRPRRCRCRWPSCRPPASARSGSRSLWHPRPRCWCWLPP